jgi:hypothetical protein
MFNKEPFCDLIYPYSVRLYGTPTEKATDVKEFFKCCHHLPIQASPMLPKDIHPKKKK